MSVKQKKKFPPGTFLPFPQRLVAILQLCFAFSLLLWYLFQPFMGEYFTLRSRMLLYEYVMGTSDILKQRPGQEEKLRRQTERFQHLPQSDRSLIEKDYQAIQTYAQRSFFQKLGDGIYFLIHEIPPFELAWIFFSSLIAILVLLKVEGAKDAIWLLPLIALAFAIDNQISGTTPPLSPDAEIFPTERMLVEMGYMQELEQVSSLDQKEELEKGWQQFLLDRWGFRGETLHPLENAEFNFTIARLKLLHEQPASKWLKVFNPKMSPYLIGCYLIWNILLAWIISRHRPGLERLNMKAQ